MPKTDPMLQLHLEPQQPIEIREFSAALGSIARQYQEFAVEEGLASNAGEAKLLVSNVQPGSIDISLLPDWITASTTVAVTGPLLAPLIDKFELVQKFGNRLKKLLELFQKDKASISLTQCTDAINIVKPTAENGGSQTFNVVHGDIIVPILVMNTREARELIERATKIKSEIQLPLSQKREKVSMIWSRLDRAASTTGKKSPDRGTIEEIDAKPHAILFSDALSYLKPEMIADEENPMQKVYFVDAEVSRAQGKVTAYRIVGYHGKDDL